MFRSEKAASSPLITIPLPLNTSAGAMPQTPPGITFFPLRQGNRLTIKIPEQPANDASAVHRWRNLDAHILIQTNGSFIKSLMVNRAAPGR